MVCQLNFFFNIKTFGNDNNSSLNFTKLELTRNETAGDYVQKQNMKKFLAVIQHRTIGP